MEMDLITIASTDINDPFLPTRINFIDSMDK